MTQYTRTISRQITNAAAALPAWVSKIVAPNTLYRVGPSQATLANFVPSSLPGGVYPTSFYGNSTEFAQMTTSWGTKMWFSDVGAFGTMVYFGTGEGVIGEQSAQWSMSDDAPVWTYRDRPRYCLSEAEAAARDADMYYSIADYKSCANKCIDEGWPGYIANTTDAIHYFKNWNESTPDLPGTWPIGYKNWIFRRRMKFTLGDNVPWWFRYETPAYVPGSIAGLGGAGSLVAMPETLHGPWQAGMCPAGLDAAYNVNGNMRGAWFANRWPSNNRKMFAHYQNVQTRQWSKMPFPVHEQPGYRLPNRCNSFLDVERKRIWYMGTGSQGKPYYLDIANGVPNATLSPEFNIAGINWNPSTDSCVPDGESGSICVVTPTGRRLWFFRAECFPKTANTVLMFDLDKFRYYRLVGMSGMSEMTYTSSSRNPRGNWGFGYNPVRNRIFITQHRPVYQGGGVRLMSFAIPSKPEFVSNYTCTTQDLAFNETQYSGKAWYTGYGKGSRYHEALDLILIPVVDSPMLAFRPYHASW